MNDTEKKPISERPAEGRTREQKDGADMDSAAIEKEAKKAAKEDLEGFIETDDELGKEAGKINGEEGRRVVGIEQEALRKEAKESYEEMDAEIRKTREGSSVEMPEGEEKVEADKVETDPEESEVVEQDEDGAIWERTEIKEDLDEDEAREGNEILKRAEEALFSEATMTEEEKQEVAEYMASDEKKEGMIGNTKEKYARELGLEGGYDADMLLKGQQDIEERLARPELVDGLKFKEDEFVKIIKEGEKLLAEGNPEKIKSYLEGTAASIDDCAKRLKYIYLQMEMSPEARQMLKEEYLNITAAIKKFEEASMILRNLMDMVDRAGAEGRNLNEEEKEQLSKFLKNLGKILLLLGAIGAILYGVSKFAASNPASSLTLGSGSALAGLSKAGIKAGILAIEGPAAATVADLLFKAAFLKIMLFDEEKRDKAIESIFGIKLPAWAKKPAKKAEGK